MTPKKRKPEEIVAKLRQVDVLLSQSRTVADPHRSAAQVDRCHRRPLRSLHPAQRARTCAFRQRPGVRRPSGAVLDRVRKSEDGLHQAGLAVGEWLFDYSFNAKLRDELLKGKIFYGLAEAKIVIESWRQFATPGARAPRSATSLRAPAAIVRSLNMVVKPTVHSIKAGPPSRGRPASAKFAFKAGLWFRRMRLVIRSWSRQSSRIQAEIRLRQLSQLCMSVGR